MAPKFSQESDTCRDATISHLATRILDRLSYRVWSGDM